MATLMIDLYVSALVGVASLRWSKNPNAFTRRLNFRTALCSRFARSRIGNGSPNSSVRYAGIVVFTYGARILGPVLFAVVQFGPISRAIPR